MHAVLTPTKPPRRLSDTSIGRGIPMDTLSNNPSFTLAACVLLAGSLKPSPLTALTGGSVLDLYLDGRDTVLSLWIRRFEAAAAALAQKPTVHVIYGTASPGPALPAATTLPLKLEEDSQEFRGPAGAARDACQGYPPESSIIIAEAARYFSGDLLPVLQTHIERRAAITVVSNEDSTPAGIFIVRCSTLDLIPRVGFTDLKEQWLKKAVDGGVDVRVHRLRGSYSYELRTRESFLRAAAIAGGMSSPIHSRLNVVSTHSPVRPDGGSAPQESATIGPGAVIIDSVVMPGASVGPGAVVARSLICPGAVVAANAELIDDVAMGPRR